MTTMRLYHHWCGNRNTPGEPGKKNPAGAGLGRFHAGELLALNPDGLPVGPDHGLAGGEFGVGFPSDSNKIRRT